MLSSAEDLAAATAFEQYVLDRATPLLPRTSTSAVIELTGSDSTGVLVGVPGVAARVSIGVTDSLGSGAAESLTTDDVRPLLFGAAWKVFDLVVELASHWADVAPDDQNGEYRIGKKVSRARAGIPPAPVPFDAQSQLWSRTLLIYAATEELRHALVHRQLTVTPLSGSMSGAPRPGGPPMQPLGADEQTAFCQLASGVVAAIVARQLTPRQVDQISWLLDQLTRQHGMASFGASEVNGLIPVVQIRDAERTSGEIALDPADIRRRALLAKPNTGHFDLEIWLADGRVLGGPLEAAPEAALRFPVADPPDWLHWK